MANISVETIRDISVQAVEDFLNNKVPLSAGLAKQAANYELNEEQVKRAVESTNNIAYLKVLQLSDDRTVEFSLAKFAEVMTAATMPENFQEKVAATISVEKAITDSGIEKAASAYEGPQLVNAEKIAYFIKSAAANKEALDRIEIESMNVAERLVKVAKQISKDEKWMDKLACVTSEQEFKQLSVLVSGNVQKYRDLTDVGLFKEAQLKDVASFSELYKQARELVREQRERSELQKQAAQTTQGIKTNSFSDALKGVSASAKNVAGKVVGAPGYAAGKVVGNLAAAPFKAVGSVASAVKDSVKSNIGRMTSKGESAGVKTVGKAVGQTTGSIGKGIIRVGGPALDAAMYDPGTDSTTGRSNDAWTALQRD